MKYLLSLNLIVVNLILISLIIGLLIGGCVPAGPQPEFYSPDEKNIMFIPKGTRIGDIVAPEDGIFIGKSRIIDLRIVEVPQPEKQKKKRT